jgi:hypothetical protein
MAGGTPNRPGQRLPRTPCDLCGGSIIWVEVRTTGRRVPINPEPVTNHQDGEFRRTSAQDAQGRKDLVDPVAENERWMHKTLYARHMSTCEMMQFCRSIGIYGAKECKAHIAQPSGRGMTQMQREDLEPEKYTRRKDL